MPNINLPQLQLPDPNGFVNALGAGMKLRRYQDEGDAAARKEALEERTLNALSTYGSSKRTPEDLNALWAGSPASAMAIEKTAATAGLSAAKTATATAQGKAAELKVALQKVELGSQLLAGVHDEPTYQAAKAQAAELELDLSQAPERYFPDWVKQRQQQGLKIKDQLGLQLQSLNVESQIEERGARTDIAQGHLDVAQAGLGERQRHNQVQEARPQSGMSLSYDDQGRPVFTSGPGAGMPKLTEAQGKATALNMRGSEAAGQLDAIEASGYRPDVVTQTQQWAGNKLGAKNRFLTPDGQRYEQAALNFGTAIGRFESGAAIPEAEWERFVQQYIAQPDDSDEVIAQKKQNRDTANRGSAIAAGPGRGLLSGPTDTVPGPTSTPASPETDQRRQRAIEAIRRARGTAP